MKNLKLFLFACTMLLATTAASAQLGKVRQLKTVDGKTVVYGTINSITTVDSTSTILDTLAIGNNTAGLVVVSCVGKDSLGNGVTGRIIYRYKKSAGTITLAAGTNISAIVTDTGLGTATWTFTTTASNNLQLRVKGKLVGWTTTWRGRIEPFYP